MNLSVGVWVCVCLCVCDIQSVFVQTFSWHQSGIKLSDMTQTHSTHVCCVLAEAHTHTGTHTRARKKEVKPCRRGYGMSQPCPSTPEEWCHTASTQECVTVTLIDRNTNTITGLCLLKNLWLFLQNKLEHMLKISSSASLFLLEYKRIWW